MTGVCPALPLTVAAGWRPRSGTTLLRVLLDNHPDLAIPHETNFVRQLWWQRVRFGDLRDPANRRRVAEWIVTETSHRSGRLRDGRFSRQDAGPTDYFVRRLRPDQFLDLRYEDLVGDSHFSLDRICAFASRERTTRSRR